MVNAPLIETIAWTQHVLASYRTRTPVMTIHAEDDMHDPGDPISLRRYAYVGFCALEIILRAMIQAGQTRVRTILDLPCGFGRVLRHLRVAFPDAVVHACDLYDNRISFCADVLGATPLQSKEELSKLSFPEPYDLIWSGSLLTHLPQDLFIEALRLFCRSLSPGGIAVITLHGRYTPINQRRSQQYMADELFLPAERAFYRTGFGYADYNTPTIYTNQSRYGISISAPSFVFRLLEEDDTVSIISYSERAWDDHQDVLVVQKRDIGHAWSWPATARPEEQSSLIT